MPFSFFAEYKPFKECFTFLKSIGWDFLMYTPLLFMNVGAPDKERRHTIYRFIVQVVAALTITLVGNFFAFYVGMRILTAKIEIKMGNMEATLIEIKVAQKEQAEINNKTDLDFFTHKHSKKDGVVKLRGER